MKDVVFGARFGNGANDPVHSQVIILHQLAYITISACMLSAFVPLLAMWICVSGHHDCRVVLQSSRSPSYRQLIF
jgi:hypothetical protein